MVPMDPLCYVCQGCVLYVCISWKTTLYVLILAPFLLWSDKHYNYTNFFHLTLTGHFLQLWRPKWRKLTSAEECYLLKKLLYITKLSSLWSPNRFLQFFNASRSFPALYPKLRLHSTTFPVLKWILTFISCFHVLTSITLQF